MLDLAPEPIARNVEAAQRAHAKRRSSPATLPGSAAHLEARMRQGHQTEEEGQDDVDESSDDEIMISQKQHDQIKEVLRVELRHELLRELRKQLSTELRASFEHVLDKPQVALRMDCQANPQADALASPHFSRKSNFITTSSPFPKPLPLMFVHHHSLLHLQRKEFYERQRAVVEAQVRSQLQLAQMPPHLQRRVNSNSRKAQTSYAESMKTLPVSRRGGVTHAPRGAGVMKGGLGTLRGSLGAVVLTRSHASRLSTGFHVERSFAEP